MTDLYERRCRLIAELHELEGQIDRAEGLEAVDALSTPNLEWSAGGVGDMLWHSKPLPGCEAVVDEN